MGFLVCFEVNSWQSLSGLRSVCWSFSVIMGGTKRWGIWILEENGLVGIYCIQLPRRNDWTVLTEDIIGPNILPKKSIIIFLLLQLFSHLFKAETTTNIYGAPAMCPIIGTGDTAMNKTGRSGPCSYRGNISQFFLCLLIWQETNWN